LSKPQKDVAAGAKEAVPADNVLEITIAATEIAAASTSGVNPYELRNDLLVEQQKERVRYKNGHTLPASARALYNDTLRKVRHARILSRNLKKAHPGQPRPTEADAHHIVAQEDRRAVRSRGYLISWGIGINDADNGVFLPRYVHTKIASLPDAPSHQVIHTDLYYLTVTTRLQIVAKDTVTAGRGMLRDIKSEIIAGKFPY